MYVLLRITMFYSELQNCHSLNHLLSLWAENIFHCDFQRKESSVFTLSENHSYFARSDSALIFPMKLFLSLWNVVQRKR